MRANPIAWPFSRARLSRARTLPDPAATKSVVEDERRRAALRAATTKRHETAT
jgi:hypothetical protein